ncbi:MAG: TonB-dependent receptor [Methylophaga sp.]|nr:TonB-dependent receptor [Methylophaga sp.]
MHSLKLLPLPLLMLGLNSAVQAEHINLPTISVEGVSAEAAPYALPSSIISVPDTGELLKKLPGANINRNGPLTSIAQYRGLFGDRVNVLIDGVRINSAGPNSMDTPLSYIPASRLESLSLYRGIAPVSSGIETIGGTILAHSKTTTFSSGEEFQSQGNFSAGYAENGNGKYGSVLAGIANNQHRLHITGSLEHGDDLEFDGGDILPTEHKRGTVGGGYAFQNGAQTFTLNAQHHDTGKTGTPALPMDIIYAKGNHYDGSFSNTFANGGVLSTKLSYQDSEHWMSNYELRASALAKRRHAITDVKSTGFGLAYSVSGWTVGIDADRAKHNADIFNPGNTLFFVNNYNNIERDRYSIFGEKELTLNQWKFEAGLRYSRVEMDAGEVSTSLGAAPVVALKNTFNNADRKQDESLVDLVLNTTYTVSSEFDLIAGIARKERAASYQERYLWLPLESTAGLADGNNYIGNIGLDTEVAYQIELGFDWHTPRATFSPHIFYHHINDYIQGTPNTNSTAAMVSAMMAGPEKLVLEYNNVDAKLYGLDANWSFAITPTWQLDGVVSYVRGERRDTSDDLYRIAPLTARTMLSYVQTDWTVGFEAETVSSQNKVSDENREQKTSGYAVFNLSANYQPTQNVIITAGVNNLFDRGYENHLGGYNRIANNPDIAQGDRLPGLGRSAYAGVSISW